MIYNFQKEFFLVRDDDTGTTKLFHRWQSVVDFLTDEIMKYGYHIIYDDDGLIGMTDWRPPKDREECFNFLFNVKNIRDLNNILEDLWHTELIKFSD
jgi:hypothetical protein